MTLLTAGAAHRSTAACDSFKRVYMLYQLKRAGISQNDLVKIYVSTTRPVLEYACPVWSTSLPTYLSDAIEMIQTRVHPGLHYDDMLIISRTPKPKEETR